MPSTFNDGSLFLRMTVPNAVVTFAKQNSNQFVLGGQLDFHQKGDNRWRAPVADSFCWPYGLGMCADPAAAPRLVVADSGNNRVSVWELGVT